MQGKAIKQINETVKRGLPQDRRPVQLQSSPRDTGEGAGRPPERPGYGLNPRSPLPLRLPSMLSTPAAFAGGHSASPRFLTRPGPRSRDLERLACGGPQQPQRPSPSRLLRASSEAADYDVTPGGRVLPSPAPPAPGGFPGFSR